MVLHLLGSRIPYGYTRKVGLDIRTGVDAKDYSEIATKENLSKMELEMRKIEDGVSDILKDLKYLRRREEKMRNTNGKYLRNQKQRKEERKKERRDFSQFQASPPQRE